MNRIGLSDECKDLELIIEDLTTGKGTCEIGDTHYSLEDTIDYLRDFLQELENLDNQIVEHGNTPELLEQVHEKYSELPFRFQNMLQIAEGAINRGITECQVTVSGIN